jgi:nucleoside-diphosphate-sugar epimerase
VLGSVRVVECDLGDLDTLDARIRETRPDVCFHLAWYAVPGVYLDGLENLSAIQASIGLARLLERAGCQRFIGVGTCFEYDTRGGYLSEESPVRPESVYAASKLALQLVLEQVSAVSRLRYAWARLFYLYGPMEHPARLVPSVIRALLNDQPAAVTLGQQVRDFLHVQDVASALCDIASSALDGVVNIGSGEPVTVAEVVSKLACILERAELVDWGGRPYHPREPMFICANAQRLMATGWRPSYDLETGLADAARWWRTQLVSSARPATLLPT